MRRLTMIMIIAAAAVGCCRFDVDEVLLERDDISLTLKGEQQMVYDPLTCQLSHNKGTNEYRMYDDKLSYWMTVKCSERPDTEGQSLSADITWTASSSTRTEHNLKFVVRKISPDGRIWMWNKTKRIGIVIKNL